MGAYGDQTHPTSPGRSSFLPMAPSGLSPLVGALGPVDWEQEARKRQRGALAEAAVLQAVRQGGVSPRAAQQTMQQAGPVGPSLPISALSAGSGALPANLQSDLLYMMRRSLYPTYYHPEGPPAQQGGPTTMPGAMAAESLQTGPVVQARPEPAGDTLSQPLGGGLDEVFDLLVWMDSEKIAGQSQSSQSEPMGPPPARSVPAEQQAYPVSVPAAVQHQDLGSTTQPQPAPGLRVQLPTEPRSPSQAESSSGSTLRPNATQSSPNQGPTHATLSSPGCAEGGNRAGGARREQSSPKFKPIGLDGEYQGVLYGHMPLIEARGEQSMESTEGLV